MHCFAHVQMTIVSSMMKASLPRPISYINTTKSLKHSLCAQTAKEEGGRERGREGGGSE